MRKILKKIIKGKNENYSKAMIGLRNVKKNFDGFVISFPDVTPDEIMFIKNKWEVLPKNISKGVKIMALNLVNDCKYLITSYNINSYIVPHDHNDEYEVGVILKGKLIDKFTGKTYGVGDTYVFQPNQVHYLSSTNEPCLVYSRLSYTNDIPLELLPEKISFDLGLT